MGITISHNIHTESGTIVVEPNDGHVNIKSLDRDGKEIYYIQVTTEVFREIVRLALPESGNQTPIVIHPWSPMWIDRPMTPAPQFQDRSPKCSLF